MIHFLKNIARKSAFAKALYWKTIFLTKAVRYDFFSPRRLMLFLKVRPFTMVSYERLKNTYELAESLEKRNIAGAFVECGVWKGGAAAVMAVASAKKKEKRQIWLFDSFE
ncbi:MAG: TylF/MycF/NovP-related O-methyltransferase, partial [bacterium]|nr:TylF/MycF/NovP-related O-methyltransferase [bacterium]